MMLPHAEGRYMLAPAYRKVRPERVYRGYDIVDVAVDEAGLGPLQIRFLCRRFGHLHSSSVLGIFKRPVRSRRERGRSPRVSSAPPPVAERPAGRLRARRSASAGSRSRTTTSPRSRVAPW